MVDPVQRVQPRWRRRAEIGSLLALGVAVGWTGHALFGSGPDPVASPTSTNPIPGPRAPVSPDPHATQADRNAESTNFWGAAALALAARSGRFEALLEELESQDRRPRESLEQAIANSSDQELATVLSAVTQIDEDELLAKGDLRPFASRLVDVALDGLDGPSAEPDPPRRVVFTATTGDFDRDTSARTTFPPDQDRIFAMIELDDHDGNRVLVKWLNEDTKRVYSLQTMAYDPSQPIWSYLARDGDWDPGRYEVSFYSQDAEMDLLGRGVFTVF